MRKGVQTDDFRRMATNVKVILGSHLDAIWVVLKLNTPNPTMPTGVISVNTSKSRLVGTKKLYGVNFMEEGVFFLWTILFSDFYAPYLGGYAV